MAYVQRSAYCPTQKAYTMTLTNTAYQTSVTSGSGYQSLYSEERRDLDQLDIRKETFIFYPESSIPTADIAAAGFFYTGEGHVIKCFCCRLTVTRLNDGDNPFLVHQCRAPNCSFVRKTVVQGGVRVQEPAQDEDMLDGVGLNTDSLPSDVEDDGPLQDDIVARGLPNTDDKPMVAWASAKPRRLTAPKSKQYMYILSRFWVMFWCRGRHMPVILNYGGPLVRTQM